MSHRRVWTVLLTLLTACAKDPGTPAANSGSGSPAGQPAIQNGKVGPSAGQSASTSGGGTLCPDLGWCELKDTKLASVCPDVNEFASVQANEGCSGVINDWSGGMADTKRNRLLIWGGGHAGYFGNELYALDLKKLAMLRLNDPSDITGVDLKECKPPETYQDGRPSSRHTYDGMTYLTDRDQLYTFAGAGVPCGYAVISTWLLDLGAVDSAASGKAAPWIQKRPEPYPTKGSVGLVSDYDADNKRVILNDGYNLWSYDAAANAYTLLNDSNATSAHIDYHMTGRVDPKRKLFIAVGGGGSSKDGGMQVFDISESSDHAQQRWTSQVKGCDALLNAASPGFAYDDKQDQFVGWAGGDDVYAFDPDTKFCSKLTFGGGPGNQNMNGTFGRFRYFPELNVFAVVSDYQRNAYSLRLTR